MHWSILGRLAWLHWLDMGLSCSQSTLGDGESSKLERIYSKFTSLVHYKTLTFCDRVGKNARLQQGLFITILSLSEIAEILKAKQDVTWYSIIRLLEDLYQHYGARKRMKFFLLLSEKLEHKLIYVVRPVQSLHMKLTWYSDWILSEQYFGWPTMAT